MHDNSAGMSKYNRIIDAIQKVSPSRRYQTRLIIFFLVCSLCLHFSSHMIAYLFNNAVFDCTYSSSVIEEKEGCEHLDECTISKLSITKKIIIPSLHIFIFIVKKKTIRNTIKSMKGVGIWLGLIFMGIMSDKFGKRKCIIIGLIAVNTWFITIMSGSLLNNTPLLIIAELSFGFGFILIESLSYIFITRFLDKQSYERLTVGLFLTGHGVSLVIQGIVTSFVMDWMKLISVSALPILIVLALSFSLKEDPYFLLESGRTEQCMEVIRYIGNINGAEESVIREQQDLIRGMQIQDGEDRVYLLNVLKALPLNLQLLKLVVVLGIVGMAAHISEASFNFTAQEVGYTYQTNISIMGLATIFSSLTFMFVLKCESQRKRGFIWSTTIEAFLSVLYLTAPLKTSKMLQAGLLFTLKFLKCWGTNFYTRLKVDCLPKRYQGTLTSIILLIGKVSLIIDPHIIQWQSDNGFNVIVSNHCIKFFLGTCVFLFLTEKYYELREEGEYMRVAKDEEERLVANK